MSQVLFKGQLLGKYEVLDSLGTGEPQSLDAAAFIARCATPEAAKDGEVAEG